MHGPVSRHLAVSSKANRLLSDLCGGKILATVRLAVGRLIGMPRPEGLPRTIQCALGATLFRVIGDSFVPKEKPMLSRVVSELHENLTRGFYGQRSPARQVAAEGTSDLGRLTTRNSKPGHSSGEGGAKL